MSEQRLIDADALLKDIDLYCGDYFEHGDRAYDKVAVKVAIKSAPTIEARPVVRGEWELQSDGTHFCSVCGRDAVYTFDGVEICSCCCAYCGARMDGDA